MPHFSQRMDVPNKGRLSFYFTRMFTVQGVRYFVYTSDQKSEVCNFKMVQVGDDWVLVDKEHLPSWIAELEKELHFAILNH